MLVLYALYYLTYDVPPSNCRSHSWLSYGVDPLREKVWIDLSDDIDAALVENAHTAQQQQKQQHPDDATSTQNAEDNNAPLNRTIPNPCLPLGYEEVMHAQQDSPAMGDKVILRGTGNPTECVSAIMKVLWPQGHCFYNNNVTVDSPSSSDSDNNANNLQYVSQQSFSEASGNSEPAFGPCALDGVEHPKMASQEFFAMSVYFYALDCIRQLSPTSMPRWYVCYMCMLVCAYYLYIPV